MPTKKPRIQALVENAIYEKFKILAKDEMRSESQLAGFIITKYINDYENQNGMIKIENAKNIITGGNNSNFTMQ